MTDTPTPPQPAVDWRKASEEERRTRELRDQAIVAARRAGRGVREIAREFGIDPTQVGRVLRREEEREERLRERERALAVLDKEREL